MDQEQKHKCELCKVKYAKETELREHFWSLLHHLNLEKKSSNAVHTCTACKEKFMTLALYSRHLGLNKHKKAVQLIPLEVGDNPKGKATTKKKQLQQNDQHVKAASSNEQRKNQPCRKNSPLFFIDKYGLGDKNMDSSVWHESYDVGKFPNVSPEEKKNEYQDKYRQGEDNMDSVWHKSYNDEEMKAKSQDHPGREPNSHMIDSRSSGGQKSLRQSQNTPNMGIGILGNFPNKHDSSLTIHQSKPNQENYRDSSFNMRQNNSFENDNCTFQGGLYKDFNRTPIFRGSHYSSTRGTPRYDYTRSSSGNNDQCRTSSYDNNKRLNNNNSNSSQGRGWFYNSNHNPHPYPPRYHDNQDRNSSGNNSYHDNQGHNSSGNNSYHDNQGRNSSGTYSYHDNQDHNSGGNNSYQKPERSDNYAAKNTHHRNTTSVPWHTMHGKTSLKPTYVSKDLSSSKSTAIEKHTDFSASKNDKTMKSDKAPCRKESAPNVPNMDASSKANTRSGSTTLDRKLDQAKVLCQSLKNRRERKVLDLERKVKETEYGITEKAQKESPVTEETNQGKSKPKLSTYIKPAALDKETLKNMVNTPRSRREKNKISQLLTKGKSVPMRRFNPDLGSDVNFADNTLQSVSMTDLPDDIARLVGETDNLRAVKSIVPAQGSNKQTSGDFNTQSNQLPVKVRAHVKKEKSASTEDHISKVISDNTSVVSSVRQVLSQVKPKMTPSVTQSQMISSETQPKISSVAKPHTISSVAQSQAISFVAVPKIEPKDTFSIPQEESPVLPSGHHTTPQSAFNDSEVTQASTSKSTTSTLTQARQTLSVTKAWDAIDGKKTKSTSLKRKLSDEPTKSKPKKIPKKSDKTQSSQLDKILKLSLQEESLRSTLTLVNENIGRLKEIILQSQTELGQLETKRNKLGKDEEKLRRKRMQILKGAVSQQSDDSSESSLSPEIDSPPITLPIIKQEPVSPILLIEPDTSFDIDLENSDHQVALDTNNTVSGHTSIYGSTTATPVPASNRTLSTLPNIAIPTALPASSNKLSLPIYDKTMSLLASKTLSSQLNSDITQSALPMSDTTSHTSCVSSTSVTMELDDFEDKSANRDAAAKNATSEGPGKGPDKSPRKRGKGSSNDGVTLKYMGTVECTDQYQVLQQLATQYAKLNNASYSLLSLGEPALNEPVKSLSGPPAKKKQRGTKKKSEKASPSIKVKLSKGKATPKKVSSSKVKKAILPPSEPKYPSRTGTPECYVKLENIDLDELLCKETKNKAESTQFVSKPDDERKKRRKKKDRDLLVTKSSTMDSDSDSNLSHETKKKRKSLKRTDSHTESIQPGPSTSNISSNNAPSGNIGDNSSDTDKLVIDCDLEEKTQECLVTSSSSEIPPQDRLKIQQPALNAIKDKIQSINKKKQEMRMFEAHTKVVVTMTVHGDYIYTGSQDGLAKRFHVQTFKNDITYQHHTKTVYCLKVIQVYTQLCVITGGFDKQIAVFNAQTGSVVVTIACDSRVYCMHEAWMTLYVGCDDGALISISLKKDVPVLTDKQHVDGGQCISCITSTTEGPRKVLILGMYCGLISVRDAVSGILLREIKSHDSRIISMDIHSSYNLMYTLSQDSCYIQIHNVCTGEQHSSVHIYSKSKIVSISVANDDLYVSASDGSTRRYRRCFDMPNYYTVLMYYGLSQRQLMCHYVDKDNKKIYHGVSSGEVVSVPIQDMNIVN